MDRIAIQNNCKSLVLKGTINNRRAFLSLAFFYKRPAPNASPPMPARPKPTRPKTPPSQSHKYLISNPGKPAADRDRPA